jgi:hypothetical protein
VKTIDEAGMVLKPNSLPIKSYLYNKEKVCDKHMGEIIHRRKKGAKE